MPSMTPSHPVSERIALVTGGNKGIGFEVSRQLAKAGLLVLLGARDAERGRQAEATLKAEGLNVRSLALDLGEDTTIEAAQKVIEQEFGGLTC